MKHETILQILRDPTGWDEHSRRTAWTQAANRLEWNELGRQHLLQRLEESETARACAQETIHALRRELHALRTAEITR